MKRMSKSDALTYIGTAIILVELFTLIGIHTVKGHAQSIDIYEAPPVHAINEVETSPAPAFTEKVETADAPALETEPETLYPAPKETYLGQFKLTAYCGCSTCNGKWAGIDCFGNPLEPGVIAVDPKVIPLGSKVRIGDAIYTARDTGGKWVKGEHVDIYMNTHHAAKMFGTQWGDVYLINE